MSTMPRREPETGGGMGGGGNPGGSSIRPAIRAAEGEAPAATPSKIQAFEQKLGVKRHEDTWKRSPNTPGTGAIHVKSFHCRLSDDALAYLDQQVNEWLDAHPQYEVKFATTAIGEFQGKMGKEMHMIVQLWV